MTGTDSDRTRTIAEFFRRLLPIRAENPPGDTREVAQFIVPWLEELRVDVHVKESREGMANLWCSIGDSGASRHLVLCGHMDTFPIGDVSQWKHDPSAAVVDDGFVYGRGASAARAGLASLLWAFKQAVEADGPRDGRLTLLAVADTESGGAWGAGWVVEKMPELLGTACLLGEPEGPRAIRIGEKGKAQFTLRTRGRRYPGAFGTGDDPIIRLAQAIGALRSITQMEASDVPPEIDDAIRELGDYARTPEEAGLTPLLRKPSLNVGKIEGGTKVNLSPESAHALVDVRTPFGMTSELIDRRVRAILDQEGLDDVVVEPIEPRIEPSFTSPSDPFVAMAAGVVREVTGEQPALSLGYASTDARYFRPHGIPAIVYGPTPHNIGGFDEAIRLEELETIADVHQKIITRYLDF